ncbi:MAG: replication-relaxation family protein [Solirubrobacterales bacterium]
MTSRNVTRALLDELLTQLDERDLAVLRSVADLRFVSGAQLQRMHFYEAPDPAVNARSARRCLLRLVRVDLLVRLPRRVGGVRSGSAGFIYHLGLAGQRLAVLLGWHPDRRRRRSQLPGTFFLKHSLATSELHTLLIEGDRASRFELLELVAEPACWRSYGGVGNQGQATLKPDSYARIGVGEFEDSYFFEVDRGSEGSKAIQRKLREYMGYAASGQEQESRGVFPRVLWLTPDEDRALAIGECVRRLPMSERELFAVARLGDAADVVSDTSSLTQSQPT